MRLVTENFDFWPLFIPSEGTVTEDTEHQRNGQSCAAVPLNGSRSNLAPTITPTLGRAFFYRMAFKVDALPAANLALARVRDNNNSILEVLMTPSGEVELWAPVEEKNPTGSATVAAAQWFAVEVKLAVAAEGNSKLSWRIDGVEKATDWEGKFRNLGAKVVWPGNPGAISQTSQRVYVDDLAINDDQGSVNNSWVGLEPDPVPTEKTRYIGALIGETATTLGAEQAPYNEPLWDEFEADATRKMGIIHMSDKWPDGEGPEWDGYLAGASDRIHARNAIPLKTLGGGPDVIAEVLSGDLDGEIRNWATGARNFSHPFFLRLWWEMNGTWYAWGRSPTIGVTGAEYVAAWRHFHDLVAPVAPNCTFVWCPNALFGPETDPFTGSAGNFYPGDAYVDWTGMDGYTGENPHKRLGFRTPRAVFLETYERLQEKAPNKPIIICEAGCSEYAKVAATEPEPPRKAEWIRQLLGHSVPVEMPNVRAVLWFNRAISEGGGHLDWPIESSESAREAFAREINLSGYVDPQARYLKVLKKVPLPGHTYGSAALGNYGAGSYGSGTYGNPVPVRVAVRGRSPMRQHVLVTTPGGRTYRWAEDEPGAEQVLEDLQDSDSVPGGHKEASASLSRKPGVDYSDIQRGSRLEVFGSGGHRISEYRLERAPRSTGEKLIIEPAAVGYQGHLTDDESVQCIPIDQDMSAWGSPSSRQIAEWTAAKINQNASVELLPAGDPLGSGHPAISHKWGQINSSVANPDVAISTYDSGGVELGELLVGQFVNVKGGSGGSWITQVSSMADDTGTGATSLHDYNATTAASATYSIAAEQFYIRLLSGYFGTRSEQGNWEQQYRGLVVQDRSGIPLQGSWPAVGVLASDVIAYVLQKWAPLINFTTGQFGSLRATSYPIPHLAFKERTTVQDVIAQALRYELLEWGVWGSASGPQFFLNGRGEREGRKRWRARIRPSKLEESGPQLDKVINGCLVSYQDPDGSTRWVGPPGSGCRIESERLLDQDPLNPVNQIGGLKRWARKSLKGIGSPEAAIEAGEREIVKSKELDGSGKATLTGYVEDEHGVEWPYYCVQAGDLIEFLGSSIKGYRYIIDADRSRSSRSVAIELDAPPDTTEAFIERDNAALVELGLAS